MDLNRTPYRRHYEVEPGETPRDIHIIFNDDDKYPLANAVFAQPFTAKLNKLGKRNLGISLRSLNLVNAPMNIGEHLQNNKIYVDYPGPDTVFTLRDGFYPNVDSIIAEINSLIPDIECTMVLDHISIVQLRLKRTLYIPCYDYLDRLLPDHLGVKLGFIDVQLVEGKPFVIIDDTDRADQPGDIYGPTSEALVVCNEAVYTHETQRVIYSACIAAHPVGSYCTFRPTPIFRELEESYEHASLTLRICDRANRPMRFVTGTPSGTIDLMHLS